MIGRKRTVDVLIFTPKEEELFALRSLLQKESSWQDPVSGLAYRLGTVKGKGQKLRVGILCSGKGLLKTQAAVREAIATLRPRVAILFGTAAGLKHSAVGDVLVGDEGRYYGQGRITEKGFRGHPVGQRSTLRLVERARMLLRDTPGWYQYLPADGSEKPRYYIGPIVCGDKVLTTNNAELNEILKQQHSDAIGKEMEAYPFLIAALGRPGVEAIIIRGVSDRLGDKEEENKKGSKDFALARAAAFLRFYLEELNLLPEESRPKRWPVALGLLMMLGLSLLLYHFSAPATPPENVPELVLQKPVDDAPLPPVVLGEKDEVVDKEQERIVEKAPASPSSTPGKTGPTVAFIPLDTAEKEVSPPSSEKKEDVPEIKAGDVSPSTDMPSHITYEYKLAIYDEELKKLNLNGAMIGDKIYPVSSDGIVELPLGMHVMHLKHNKEEHEIILNVSKDTLKNGLYLELR